MKQMPGSLVTDYRGNIKKGLGGKVVAKHSPDDQAFAKELCRRWNICLSMHKALKKAITLLKLCPITAEMVEASGPEAVEAAQLGSWHINQTKMGSDLIDLWHIEDVLEWVVEKDLEEKLGTKESMLHENLLLFMKDFKEACGKEFSGSLTMLLELAQKGGMEITAEQQKEYFSREVGR